MISGAPGAAFAGQDVRGDSLSGVDVLALSRQLVLVVADDWRSTNAWLRRYDADESGWKLASDPIRVSLGYHGLAWGRGINPTPMDGPQKREGDGRSPAGVFPLPYVFGKAPLEAVKGIHMPYVQCTGSLECVDDTNSIYYNQMVDRTNVNHVDWRSSEKMLTSDDQYRLGVVVQHNFPAHPGAGSCIFLHVWASPGHVTSGCTAMPLGDMEALVVWLDHAAQPVLVQLPRSEYNRVKSSWRLPDVSTNAP